MNPDAPVHTTLETPHKLTPQHLERLAVVYIRQSTLQQVQHHRESTQAQYGLAEFARSMGWPKDRIVVIDEDLGRSGASSEDRLGFQRLLSEVALDHVGIIIGIEISRLARSCKDWYQLLELCALFGTLIRDLDGLYDPTLYNDRLLLGLKGTMSEAELHIIRQRMFQGIQQKARRGELVSFVPIGYMRDAQGQVTLDTDEQVRATVTGIFDMFSRIGTVRGVLMQMRRVGMMVGVRVHKGPDHGQLVWHQPNTGTLRNMLSHPMYAGAYVYGRRGQHKNAKRSGGRFLKPCEQWQVLLRDRMPAYITWDQYQTNLEQMRHNRSAVQSKGAIRNGSALLSGLVFCRRCGYRMSTDYSNCSSGPRYNCRAASTVYGEPRCQGLTAAALDAEVVRLTLMALEPSALEVSVQVADDLQAQFDSAEKLWQQRIERARYEADRARRQYESVEPENRLVARTVETEWERKLQAHRQLLDQHEQFLREQPRLLTVEEQLQIRSLAADLPTLWNAATTTNQDRKAILRNIIEKIVVGVEDDTQWVEARIHWIGGQQTYARFRRPVARIEQLSDFAAIRECVLKLRQAGTPISRIAAELNQRGFRTILGTEFTIDSVRTWLYRYGPAVKRSAKEETPGDEEWFISDLARKWEISTGTIHAWISQGKLRARRQSKGVRAWIVCATESQMRKLMRFRADKPDKSPDGRPRRYYQRSQLPIMSGEAL